MLFLFFDFAPGPFSDRLVVIVVIMFVWRRGLSLHGLFVGANSFFCKQRQSKETSQRDEGWAQLIDLPFLVKSDVVTTGDSEAAFRALALVPPMATYSDPPA